MYLESYHIYKMELFMKMVIGFQPLIIFTKRSTWDVWPTTKYMYKVRFKYTKEIKKTLFEAETEKNFSYSSGAFKIYFKRILQYTK